MYALKRLLFRAFLSKETSSFVQILTNYFPNSFYNSLTPSTKWERRCDLHYELYIDLYFFINFFMDYVLLLITSKLLKCRTSIGRRMAGAVVGALLTCIITVGPVPYVWIKLLLSHGVVNVVMIKIGLKIGWNREFTKAYLLLYISSLLMGGILGAFRQYISVGSLFLALAILSYEIAMQIWDVLRYLARQHENQCVVRLVHQGQQMEVCAMIDTGNHLRDPLTKKPVSILGMTAAKKLFKDHITEELRYISYQSVGKTDGVMPLKEVQCAYMDGDGGKQVECFLVAICQEDLWEGTYEMILNPEVL